MNVELRRDEIGTSRVRFEPFARRGSKENLRLRLYATLAVADTLSISAAMLLSDLIRTRTTDVSIGLHVLALLLPLYLTFAVNGRAYSVDVLLKPRTGVKRALGALGVATAALVFVAFSLHTTQDFSRLLMAVGFVASALALTAERVLVDRVVRRSCGDSPLGAILILDGIDPAGGMEQAQIIHAHEIGIEPDISSPMMMDRLGRLTRYVDRVIVACPPERRSAWSMALKGANVSGEILAPELSELGLLGTGNEAGHVTLKVSAESLSLQDRTLKRLLDIMLASAAIFVLLPLMLVIALAVKLEDGGSVLFVQQRLGRGNRLFGMYKFRSMTETACDSAGAQSTQRGDARVTRIGRLIRATSVDELPQLLNILKGDMSVVGPRPHALGSLAGEQLFWEVDTRYWHRHASKPGLTGLAQVRGFRGATHHRIDLVNRLQADLEYQRDWTILRDFSIILATFRVIVHRNAF